MADDAGAKADGGAINLVVKDQASTEIAFKIKRHTPLEKLMNAYCTKKAIAKTEVRFIFDGERVQGHTTPQDLDMEDGDIIEVVVTQVGGARVQAPEAAAVRG